eukprot:Gb_27513 [translate_table: standard]
MVVEINLVGMDPQYHSLLNSWAIFWSWVFGSIFLAVWMLNVWIATRKKKKLPPGPPAWPIVGNLFQLGKNSNQSLFFLARKYGPLMTLRLGMKTAVVISSPSMAKEVLKNNDQMFAGRPSGKVPFLRPDIPGMHLRRDQVSRAVEGIYEDCLKKKSVNIGHTVFHTSFNLLGNMILSQDMFDPRSNSSKEIKETIGKYLEIVGTPNMADYFPLLQFLDLQGLTRHGTIYLQRLFGFFDEWIENRLESRRTNVGPNMGPTAEKDFLDILLDLRTDNRDESSKFTLEDIRGLLFDILLAGGETSATTIEWAMAELILNPEKLKKAQAELEEIVGAESCCEIGGFFIPKNAQIIVNVWAIGRDPGIWNEAMEFIPERFMQSDINYKGHDFELIPFGAERRICVGLPLASRMVLFVLASLLHSFEWSLPDGEQIDMSEKFAITMQKAIPLNAIPTPRLPSNLYVC